MTSLLTAVRACNDHFLALLSCWINQYLWIKVYQYQWTQKLKFTWGSALRGLYVYLNWFPMLIGDEWFSIAASSSFSCPCGIYSRELHSWWGERQCGGLPEERWSHRRRLQCHSQYTRDASSKCRRYELVSVFLGLAAHLQTFSSLLSPGGVDFEPISRTFTFPSGNNSACTTIAVADDHVALEGAEQFTVELTLPPGQPGLQLGSNRQTTITITDNDGRTAKFKICSLHYIFTFSLHYFCSCECGVC